MAGPCPEIHTLKIGGKEKTFKNSTEFKEWLLDGGLKQIEDLVKVEEKTPMQKAKDDLAKAKENFRKAGAQMNLGPGGVDPFVDLIKAYARVGILKVKDIIAQFRIDFPGDKKTDEEIEKAIEKVKKDAEDAYKKQEALADKSEKKVNEAKKLTWNKFYKGYVRKFEDISGNVKEALKNAGGEETVMLKDISNKSSGKAGLKIKENDQNIFKGLNKKQMKDLGTIIKAKRNMALDEIYDKKGKTRLKHEAGTTKEEYTEALLGLELRNKAEFDDLSERADKYFAAQDALLDLKKENGLLSQEAYDEMKEQVLYSPRIYLSHMETVGKNINGGKSISVGDAGVKALDEGSEGLMETDPRFLLAVSTQRTYSIIAKNNAAKSLLDFAKNNPDNGIVRERPVVGTKKDGTPIYAETPTGESIISAMVDGQKKDMFMKDEYAKEWVSSDPEVSAALASAFQWLSGATLLRYTATGINPLFALANAPRDMAYIYLTTDAYSKILPKAIAQMHADMAAVAKDAFTRSGRYKELIEESGSIDLLTHQGRFDLTKGVGEGINKVSEVLGYVGETSELLTRLAMRERGIKNGTEQFIKDNNRNPNPEELKKIKIKASYDAINQLDFSQGGSWAKALNKLTPYLNATFLATRGFARAARTDPKSFSLKAAQLVTFAGGLAVWNLSQEGYSQVSDDEKTRNYIIMLGGMYTTDENGNKEYMYLKIPKSQEVQFISAIGENAAEFAATGKARPKQVMQALEAQAPPIPFYTQQTPITELIKTYKSNYDDFYDKALWKGQGNKAMGNIYPWMEYNPVGSNKTPSVYKVIGKAADKVYSGGVSPERMRGAWPKLFANPEKNPFITIPGKAFNVAVEGMGLKEKEELNKEFSTHIDDMVKGIYGKFFGKTKNLAYEKEKELLRKINSEDLQRSNYIKEELEKAKGKSDEEKAAMQEEFDSRIDEEYADDPKIAKSMKKAYQTGIDNSDLGQWYIRLISIPDRNAAQIIKLKIETGTQQEVEDMTNIITSEPKIYTPGLIEELDKLGIEL